MRARRIQCAASLLLCSTFLTSCGVPDLDERGVTQYLTQHYRRDFTILSTQTVPRSQRNYLDPRMEPISETQEDHNADDIIDLCADENGVQFHVCHYLRYGVVGSWVIVDDYPTQWLMSQPELYAPLEASEYSCTYYNTFGYFDLDERQHAGFTLTVSRYEDIRPAAELAFRTVRNDAAVLPDYGATVAKQDASSFRLNIIPAIDIVSADGTLASLPFRTQQIPQTTDEENFIRLAQSRFLSQTEDTDFSELYGDPIPVYIGNTQVAKLVTDYWKDYEILDAVPLEEPLDFQQLRTICEACGYTFTPKKNRLTIQKGDDTIVFSCRAGNGYDRSIFYVYKNGNPYIPEGFLNDVLQENHCRLSIADYQYLFGITIRVDYDENRAEILP